MKKSETKLKEKNQKKEKIRNKPNKKITDIYDAVVKSTCEDIKNKKDVECHVLLISNNNKIVVAQLGDCNNFNERSDVLSLLAKNLIKEKISINAAISISEAYMTLINKDEVKKDKDEVLFFTAIDEFGNQMESVYKIIRDKDDIDLENIMNDDGLKLKNNLLQSFWVSYK